MAETHGDAVCHLATRSSKVLALPGFRSFWIAQLMVSTVSGTIRFAFVWLVLDLSELGAGWSGSSASPSVCP